MYQTINQLYTVKIFNLYTVKIQNTSTHSIFPMTVAIKII